MGSDLQDGQQPLALIGGVWRRRKWLAGGVFLVVALPALCLLWSLPRVYEATAVLVPTGGVADLFGTSTGSGADTSLGLIGEELLSRQNLVTILRDYGAASRRGPSPSGAAIEAFRKNIDIKREQSVQAGNDVTYALSISYRGWKPETVAAVTNGLAASYRNIAAELQSRRSADAIKALKSRLDALQSRLTTQQGGIDDFLKRHLSELPEQQQLNLAALERYNRMLEDNQNRQLQILSERADLISTATHPGADQLQTLEQRLAILRTQYTDQYPDVVELKARIARLKSRGASQVAAASATATSPAMSNRVAALDTELATLRRKESRLEKQVAAYQSRVQAVPVTGQQLSELTRNYGDTSDIYASLLKSYEQARAAQVTASDGGQGFSILEPAVVPDAPAGPRRLRFTGVILFLGLGIAGLAALVMDKRDASFHDLDELRAFTSVPILATVPFIRTPTHRRARIMRIVAAAVVVVAVACLLGAGAYRVGLGNETVAQALSQHK